MMSSQSFYKLYLFLILIEFLGLIKVATRGREVCLKLLTKSYQIHPSKWIPLAEITLGKPTP